MRLKRTSDRAAVTLADGDPIGAGGEGAVFDLQPPVDVVAKLYTKERGEMESKLAAMLANPPVDPMAEHGRTSIAWPVDGLRDESGTFVGFLMPRVSGTAILSDYLNPKRRRRVAPAFRYDHAVAMASNLAAAFHAVHETDAVIGDVNESNVLAANDTIVTLIDTDSFQVRDPRNNRIHPCPVGKGLYTPQELHGVHYAEIERKAEHDRFGLAVLIHQLMLQGEHPFDSVVTGVGGTTENRIKAGQFVHANKPKAGIRPRPLGVPYATLDPELQALFERSFVDGHRSAGRRPTAEEWRRTLLAFDARLTACKANPQHRYGSHLQTCPWCERRSMAAALDPFPPLDDLRSGAANKSIRALKARASVSTVVEVAEPAAQTKGTGPKKSQAKKKDAKTKAAKTPDAPKASGKAEKKAFPCPHCVATFAKQSRRDRHVSSVHTQKSQSHKCTECDAAFASATALGNHRQSKHPQKHPCSHCNAVCVSAASLKKHVAKVHNLATAISSNAAKTKQAKKKPAKATPDKRNAAKAKPNKAPSFRCPTCGKTFGSTKGMGDHHRHMHGRAPPREAASFVSGLVRLVKRLFS